jgi:hypothetical protein
MCSDAYLLGDCCLWHRLLVEMFSTYLSLRYCGMEVRHVLSQAAFDPGNGDNFIEMHFQSKKRKRNQS